jgi:hypothetical protein
MDYDKIIDLMKRAKPAINRHRYYVEQSSKYPNSAATGVRVIEAREERDAALESLRRELNR